MKRTLLIAAALILSLASFAQVDKAKFYIEGDIATPSSKSNYVWKLYNIKAQGIDFADTDTIYGHDTEKGVQLIFEHASTTHPQGFDCGLKFYRWQNSKNAWQVDSEVENAQAAFTQQKAMTIMLVLDCSSSIGASDFVKLKLAAKQFIDVIAEKSDNGNVSIGVVGFSSMDKTEFCNIQPLTPKNKQDMFAFIDQLQLNNRTALYYAMDKSLDNVEKYVKQQKLGKNVVYDGTFVIAFTDGYDNDSFDPAIGKSAEGTEHKYFQHVDKRIQRSKIGGARIESYLLSIRGNDVPRDNQDFEKVLSSLSHNSQGNKYYSLINFDKLRGAFSEIGENLINQWQNITCYIPRGYDGKVRWTIECGDVARKVFLGANASLGYNEYPDPNNEPHLYGGFMGAVGLDLTFPMTDLISVGGYMELNVANGLGFGFAPEVSFSFPNNASILLGIGYRGASSFQNNGFLMRAGLKWTGPWYGTVSYSIGNGKTFLLGVGYTILGRKLD